MQRKLHWEIVLAPLSGVMAPLSGVNRTTDKSMVYVYIIRSLKDDKYYIGITKNLENRLIKHNRGEVFSTKARAPFILIKSEEFNSYSNARKREKEIKSYKGGNKFKELIV